MPDAENGSGGPAAAGPPIGERKLRRHLWNAAGTLSLALGLVGVALPVVPTTPFLLLAAACYLRGSRRMYEWMTGNRWFGQYLRDYMERRGISVRAKAAALVMLWALMSLWILFMIENIIIRVLLLAVAAGVTIHIALIKTKR